MLLVLVISYLVRSGKLKRLSAFSKGIQKRAGLKSYRPGKLVLMGFLLTGY